ncbi:glutathione peroxidase [Natronobacillus azotifigens]|uniref:Glutathione peroxidase n=1 Tax=Natronobacillus azotifigens TaxID=472978 RepID=A0A9J6REJ8_9BACI|nr:glutathione peroxidase [Natronobacillus azotifigens]MCZ0703771.1 glutathione peroxidase [Natronobacillus azotifigens]
MVNIYDYEALKTNGEPVSLHNYKGNVMLVVNTASKCDFTPQFEDLQKLYDKYQADGLTILGFPCNQFNAQEPGTNEEAAEFCKLNYGVNFPIFSKVDVNGKRANPIFQFLKKEQPFQGFDESTMNGKLLKKIISDRYPEWVIGDDIKWNFTKFLIDRDGQVVKRFEPTDEPFEFEKDVQALL